MDKSGYVLLAILVLMCSLGVAGGIAFALLAFAGFFQPLAGG